MLHRLERHNKCDTRRRTSLSISSGICKAKTMQAVVTHSPASDVVAFLVAVHSNIESVNFVQYPPVPTFKEDGLKRPHTADEELDRRLRHGGKVVHNFALARHEV